MSHPPISIQDYRRAVALRDLTDPSLGPHALQLLIRAITAALVDRWGCALVTHRANPVIPIEDNYDRLHYPPDGAARDARYTRYVSERLLLRTMTTALVPDVLQRLAREGLDDVLVACPGLVYRRDAIDRLHTGEPHQLDLWRVRRGEALGVEDLEEMIALVVEACLPGAEHRTLPARHPYTSNGLQIDVRDGGARATADWVEVGECGLALPDLLRDNGLDPSSASGLAMGLGLDRILMLRKGIDDIRLLRASAARVSAQMLDLEPYRPVSMQPPIRRDLSLAVAEGLTGEELGDRVRTALGDEARSIETVEVLSETPYAALPDPAKQRLGIRAGQKNVLVRVVLRDHDRTLTHAEANRLRDRIYGALHQGSLHEWAR
ncbi:MAG: hypothetical protein V3V67_06455 [Myxococcota bacterium]